MLIVGRFIMGVDGGETSAQLGRKALPGLLWNGERCLELRQAWKRPRF